MTYWDVVSAVVVGNAITVIGWVAVQLFGLLLEELTPWNSRRAVGKEAGSARDVELRWQRAVKSNEGD